MKYRDIILTANGNLRRSKLRTFLTVSAVFVGAFTLLLTSGLGAGLKAYVTEQVNAVGAENLLFVNAQQDGAEDNPFKHSEPKKYNPDAGKVAGGFGTQTTVLKQEDIAKIKNIGGITEVIPLYGAHSEFISTGNERYIASVDQAIEGVNEPMRLGSQVAYSSDEYQVTLPPNLINPLGFKDDQDALGKKVTFGFKDDGGNLFTLDAIVKGVQKTTIINSNQPSANTAIMRAASEKITANAPAYKQNIYEAVFARTATGLDDAQVKAIKKELKDNKYGASTLKDQLGIINGVIGGITTFLNVFAAIALAAGSFGIVNTLLMAVQERTREIGLMKALGMSRRKIFLLFSIEAGLIGLWGALVAVLCANLVGRVGSAIATNTILKDFEGLHLFSFPLKSTLMVILLVVAIAIFAALLPARRASRLDPIEALRYE